MQEDLKRELHSEANSANLLEVELPEALNSKYELLEFIGEGAMGSVYKIKHRLLGKIDAIKFLHGHGQFNEQALKRFRQEALLASQLSHPNLVVVKDFGVAGEKPYLIMDCVIGKTLSAQLAEGGGLSPERFVAVFTQVCSGLSHAHAAGVVHRDLKPSNILVEQEASPIAKIIDFGIAKSVQDAENRQDLTQTGAIVGSPLYMSPEQCIGRPADKLSDIYSLGLTMYESVVGRPPLEGTNVLETVHLRLSQKPKSFAELGISYPAHLEKLIFSCLEHDPAKRPQSADQLVRALCEPNPSLLTTGKKSIDRAVYLAGVAIIVAVFVAWFIKYEPAVVVRTADSTAAAIQPDGSLESAVKLREAGQDAVNAGRFIEAERFLGQALTTFERHKQLQWQASTLDVLGQLHQRQGHFGQARNTMKRAADLWRLAYGESSPYTAYGNSRLAECLEAAGDKAAARDCFQRSLIILKDAKPSVEKQTEITRANAGLARLSGRKS
jgi:tetratricopeptide (TPR) repeat protein